MLFTNDMMKECGGPNFILEPRICPITAGVYDHRAKNHSWTPLLRR
jgi:hypothetical protein